MVYSKNATPNAWRKVRIGDICEITSSKRIFANEYRDFGIPFYRSKEIIEKQAGKNVSTELYIEESRYKEIKERFGAPQEGDILLTSVGTLGVPYVVGKEDFYFKDGNLTWLRKFKETDSTYIYYWLLSPLGKAQIDQKSIGSTQKALTIEALLKFEIDLPDLQTQQTISAILSAIDAKISNGRAINHRLEQMAQAIFKSWFVDFEPWGGVMPNNWQDSHLDSFISFQEGPGIRNWQYVPKDGVKFINIRCIQDGDLHLDTANMISCEETKGKYSHFMLNEWDIVVSTSGTLGRYAIVRKEHLPLCLNTSVIRFMPKRMFSDFSYILSYLTSAEFFEHLQTKASGSVQANFGPMHLRQIKMLIPSDDVLLEYHKAVFPLTKKIVHNRCESQNLSVFRNTLLSRLMSGEISVSAFGSKR